MLKTRVLFPGVELSTLNEWQAQYLMYDVAYYIRIGCMGDAAGKLSLLHQHLEALLVGSTLSPKLERIYLSAYLISGVVYKLSDSAKSRKFLEEGLKAVEGKLNDPMKGAVNVKLVDWLQELKVSLLMHSSQVCLLQCDFTQAAIYLQECSNICIHLAALWKILEFQIMLNWALLFQGISRLKVSKTILEKLALCTDDHIKWIAHTNLIMLSSLSPVILLLI